jgi:GntR family transcriptional regulator, transcriptional repressor for pyruvate dehydrogenase complex
MTDSEASGRKGGRVAEQIAASLKRQIVGGGMSPGDALPSERELAEKFEVNRSSVREALHRLDAMGLVEIRHGGATRVRDFLVSAGLQVLPWMVAPHGKVDPAWQRDLFEVRAMLLGWCGERAARAATQDDVERLETLVAAMEAAAGKPAKLQDLDWAFFEELVALTQNRVLALLSNIVRDVYAAHAARFRALYDKDVFDPKNHRRAVDAIRRRDPEAAGAAMRKHGESALRAARASKP